MPTPYPKCTPAEMLGLLVLLDSHKGEEDLARLADDLDLEIDEILPAADFAETLELVRVKDARVSFTPFGRKLVSASIRERKTLLREQLRKTTLFKALVRALENSPEHQLTDEEVHRLIAFTTAPADDLQLNVINWGRFTELFRYDADEHVLLPTRVRRASRQGGGRSPPGSDPAAGENGSMAPVASSGGNPALGPPSTSSWEALAPVTSTAPPPTRLVPRRTNP
ncbi:MAG: AAA-associated domain-containing protein [Thermoplasmata archaeon]|nr:AAA-associated domain-containing protein [Thermoplasmata archaeon]